MRGRGALRGMRALLRIAGLVLLPAVLPPGGGSALAAQGGGAGGPGGAAARAVRGPAADAAGIVVAGPAATAASLELVSGDGQFWYLGRQLRAPIVFRLSGPEVDPDQCPLFRVAFNSEDADRVSPLLGDPRWEEGQCLVRVWWSLGNGVGRQHLRAEVVGGDGRRATAHAVARQGARLFFGGAWTPRQDGWTTLDGTGENASVRTIDPTGAFHPILGVDFPAWPSRDRVRLAAAASSPHLDRFFFFGFSGLQAFLFGQAQEGSPVDLHLGFQLSRREIGLSGERCAPRPTCTSRDLRFGGLSLLVTVDGASTFRGLAGAVLR